MKLKILNVALISAVIVLASCNNETEKNPDNANVIETEATPETVDVSKIDSGVYFLNINDGEKVHSPLFVEMGVNGMEVEPAGKINEGKGHHHIIIDDSYIERGQMVPKDETHIHFGKGQTSDTLTLSPGMHTITLQFANGAHQSYGKNWSKTVTVEVEK